MVASQKRVPDTLTAVFYVPPMDQATPRFSIDSSMKFEAMAPVEHVNESPNAPITEMSGNYTLKLIVYSRLETL